MGATSRSSSTIVYYMLPGCKGQCTNLAGQHQKKEQQNIPNPASISKSIAAVYIPVCENSVQIESVSSVDSSVVSKGMICWVPLMICWYILFTRIEGMVVKCCSCVSLLLSLRCCHTQKFSAETFTIWRVAMFKETLMTKVEVWYLEG